MVIAMHSWPIPEIPVLPSEASQLRLFDTADQTIKPVDCSGPSVGMYVCGITPYDSTHLGHAATYLTFDLIYRQLLDAGHSVHYVQNITDVDDPLFERAQRDGVDWRELGTSQIDLFRSDMETLEVFPPQDYIGAMESIDEVITMVGTLLEHGAAYVVDDEYPDVYASIDATEHFGYESGYSRATMEQLFAERGGDPQRPGKRDPLDALIWRAAREGEPSWPSPFGPGRPGWHVECSAIATNRLGPSFAIQGGGQDLRFPHHEFSAAHAEAALEVPRMAHHYVHAGMIGLDGVKMSKSLGNLVFVSKLTKQGYQPGAIRLSLYASHYRSDRDFSFDLLEQAQVRLDRWSNAALHASSVDDATALIAQVRGHLAEDLDTVAAIAAIDAWAARVQNAAAPADVPDDRNAQLPTTFTEAGRLVADACQALMGVRLTGDSTR